MTSVQPGWYPDNTGALRWWDGQQWTAHVQPTPGAWPGMPQAQTAHLPQPQQPHVGQPPQLAQPQYAGQPVQYPAHAPQPQYGGQPLQPVQAAAPAGASTKLRHQGAAWAVGAVVLLAVISSGIALGVADSAALSSTGSSETIAQDDSPTESYAPLVTHEPVSAEQQALLESTVQRYNDAIAQQDCAAFNATTSAEYRVQYSGECGPGFFDDFIVDGFSSSTISATQSGPGLYELRVDESFTYNGESMTVRYAYVLADDAQTGAPVIEMIIDRN